MIAFRRFLLVPAALLACLAGPTLACDARGGQHVLLTASAVSVRGNHLIGRNGKIIRLTGVNRSGAEYACAEGAGIWDGPTDTNSAVRAMADWHINAVRIPLNEDCWLGINGVKPAYSRGNYQAAIAGYVTRLERFGIIPILNLHFSAPGKMVPDDQAPMADADHSPAFWRSLATYFRNDHHIIFDLFNEPYPDSNRGTRAAWSCVLHGGTCPGVGFRSAGMQQLVNVVRATGAVQPLMIAGPQYAGDLGHWLQYQPRDPRHQLIASIHIYEPNSAPCDARVCWSSQIATVARKVPVVEGEIGSKNCTARSIGPLLKWSDAHGVSYLAWAWNVGSCSGEPSLITNYGGTPTQTYGQEYKHHLAALYRGEAPHRNSNAFKWAAQESAALLIAPLPPRRVSRRRAPPQPDRARPCHGPGSTRAGSCWPRGTAGASGTRRNSGAQAQRETMGGCVVS